MALGEHWAAPPGGGGRLASNAHQDDADTDNGSLESRLHHHHRTAAGKADTSSPHAPSRAGDDITTVTRSVFAPASEPRSATCPHDGKQLKSPDSCQPSDTMTITKEMILADAVVPTGTPDAGELYVSKKMDTPAGNLSMVPEGEVVEAEVVRNEKPPPDVSLRGVGLQRSAVDDVGSEPAGGAGQSEADDNVNSTTKRPFTAEGNLDLAEYLGVRDIDSGGGDGGSGLGGLDVQISEGDEESGRTSEEEEVKSGLNIAASGK